MRSCCSEEKWKAKALTEMEPETVFLRQVIRKSRSPWVMPVTPPVAAPSLSDMIAIACELGLKFRSRECGDSDGKGVRVPFGFGMSPVEVWMSVVVVGWMKAKDDGVQPHV